ncbi:MAG: hypothetical protein WCE62_19380 [Polyangiales bacterium]
MENYIERIRNAVRRTADRITGQHVPVQRDRAPVENLEKRRLLRPPIDILENQQEVMIRADVAGALPEYLEGEQARATVSSGVLTIQIPKRSMPTPVGIPVTAV